MEERETPKNVLGFFFFFKKSLESVLGLAQTLPS